MFIVQLIIYLYFLSKYGLYNNKTDYFVFSLTLRKLLKRFGDMIFGRKFCKAEKISNVYNFGLRQGDFCHRFCFYCSLTIWRTIH